MTDRSLKRTWFTLVESGSSAVWLEGPFANEAEAQEHGRVVCDRGRAYHTRAVRLERPESEEIIGRLADWIEVNCEGHEVFRDTGMVVS